MSTKSKALYLINYQLISRSKTASAVERYVCLTAFNEDDCVERLSVSFTAVCASAC